MWLVCVGTAFFLYSMPKIKVKGKIRHLPYTKKGRAKARALKRKKGGKKK